MEYEMDTEDDVAENFMRDWRIFSDSSGKGMILAHMISNMCIFLTDSCESFEVLEASIYDVLLGKVGIQAEPHHRTLFADGREEAGTSDVSAWGKEMLAATIQGLMDESGSHGGLVEGHEDLSDIKKALIETADGGDSMMQSKNTNTRSKLKDLLNMPIFMVSFSITSMGRELGRWSFERNATEDSLLISHTNRMAFKLTNNTLLNYYSQESLEYTPTEDDNTQGAWVRGDFKASGSFSFTPNPYPPIDFKNHVTNLEMQNAAVDKNYNKCGKRTAVAYQRTLHLPNAPDKRFLEAHPGIAEAGQHRTFRCMHKNGVAWRESPHKDDRVANERGPEFGHVVVAAAGPVMVDDTPWIKVDSKKWLPLFLGDEDLFKLEGAAPRYQESMTSIAQKFNWYTHICAMPDYAKYSPEELRCCDYKAGLNCNTTPLDVPNLNMQENVNK
eukprot:m.93652 g.93652  ORF g.93652 m.93652 type:complete len:443 (-) comp13405_c0_seq2:2789-4117(-)